MNISNLFRLLYFVAAVCIVAIHANTIHTVANPAGWNILLHRVVCGWIPCWSVAFFFVCSGFFFARGKYVACNGECVPFIKGKVRSLLIPYISWSLVSALVALPLILTTNFFKHTPLLERTFLAGQGVVGKIDLLFGVMDSPCHNGVLWFVRTLMILFAMAPIWKFLARRWYGLVCLIGLFAYLHWGHPPKLINGYSWEFFFLGIVLGRLFPKSWMEFRDGQLLSHIPKFLNLSFWLYCTHTLILGYLLGLGHQMFGKSNVAIACLTLIAIPLTVVISLLTAAVVNRLSPSLFALLNGGRMFSPSKSVRSPSTDSVLHAETTSNAQP